MQRKWNTIIFSDELKFDLSVRNKNEVYHKDCLKRTVKFTASVMIWGCMSSKERKENLETNLRELLKD